MSCPECKKAADEGMVIPYRWKNATVLIVACREHGLEIITALSAAQRESP